MYYNIVFIKLSSFQP